MTSRRIFLTQTAALATGYLVTQGARLLADEGSSPQAFGPITEIAGNPHERGRQYGKLFADEIKQFLDQEIYAKLISGAGVKESALRYAGACGKVIRSECPEIADELEGMAEGTGLRLEEHILLTLHEELYHRGVLPSIPHCTAVAVGKPFTKGDATFVGQTWDWMPSVAGMSRMLEWKRTSGPSLLAYGFPGLWLGAGLNANGLALCWTSADLGKKNQSPRVGLPSYVLLSHLLYQESLDAVREAATKNRHAGWFTFVMADDKGRLLNVEGSPEAVEIQETEGRLTRVSYGTRKMTKTPDDKPIEFHKRCVKMDQWLEKAGKEIELETLQSAFADANEGVCEKTTIDMMVFDTTNRVAHLSRGPKFPGVAWKRYKFS